jgi:hypothetical protein
MQHLISKHLEWATPVEASRRGRGLDEAVNVRCAVKHAQKLDSSHRPAYACTGWLVSSTDCEEERDPRPDATSNIPLTMGA